MPSSLADRVPSVNASVKLAEVFTCMDRELQLSFTPHALCAEPTVNLGVALGGGVNYGVYPGAVEFKVDVRTLPGMSRLENGDVRLAAERPWQTERQP